MQEMLSKMNTWMIYLVLLVVTIFTAYFFIAIKNFLQKINVSMKKGRGKNSSMGCTSLFVFLIVGLFLFIVFRFLVLFSPFSSDELVAKTNAYHPDENFGDFKLVVGFFEKGEQVNEETYFIKGHRWLVKGEILQWQSLLERVGLKKMYRITHLQGQYNTAKPNSNQRANSYTLIHDDQNALWRMLSSACQAVHLVRIETISTDALIPNYKDTITLWITSKGFLVRINTEKNGGGTIKNRGDEKDSGVSTKKAYSTEYPGREEAIKR
jgi:hypothetical protein